MIELLFKVESKEKADLVIEAVEAQVGKSVARSGRWRGWLRGLRLRLLWALIGMASLVASVLILSHFY